MWKSLCSALTTDTHHPQQQANNDSSVTWLPNGAVAHRVGSSGHVAVVQDCSCHRLGRCLQWRMDSQCTTLHPARGATTPPLLTVCYSQQAALVNDVTLDYAAKTRSWLGDGVDWSLAAGFSCLISEVAVATIIIVSCAGRSCRPFLAYVAVDSWHPSPPPPARITLRSRDAPPFTFRHQVGSGSHPSPHHHLRGCRSHTTGSRVEPS